MKYRKIPVTVDAWQFSGSIESAKPLLEMSDQITWSPINDGRLSIYTPDRGRVSVYPGDWVARGPDGEFSVCKAHLFGVTYEPVT
jgi:hypothetical protein